MVWLVEAKGETADIGLDFRIGLGQLLVQMREPSAFYGIAVPATKKFSTRLKKVLNRVRELLGLQWLLVDKVGKVTCVEPSESLPHVSA